MIEDDTPGLIPTGCAVALAGSAVLWAAMWWVVHRLLR